MNALRQHRVTVTKLLSFPGETIPVLILKWILKTWNVIDGNETSGSVIDGEFLGQMSDYKFVKDPVPRS
jgi:hypothetical protein